MPLNLTDLPYELLSAILDSAAQANIRQGAQYSYGLTRASEPLQDVGLQRMISGQLSPDTLKWNATKAIRQVNRKWHDWATEYALDKLYITRWRGSERWMQSRTLDNLRSSPSSIAVYRDPFYSLRKADQLFGCYPSLASCVRRLWFNGYYGAATNALIFNVLRQCNDLEYLTVPWTALRYGDSEEWSRLLGQNDRGRSLSSLELLAVDLKQSHISDPVNQTNKKPLHSPRVNFSGLRRLKIFGQSNFMPITDDDLIAISHTAANLREVHITGTASITIDGLAALLDSSDETLETLEYTPLSSDGFEHPDPVFSRDHNEHMCRRLLKCPYLQNISISLPCICTDLFSESSVQWTGEMQVRTSTICGRHPLSLKTSQGALDSFKRILGKSRSLMLSRTRENVDLSIEIFIGNWIFEPGSFLVHGNFEMAEVFSDGTWPMEKSASGKGPYGQTGLYGKDDKPYEAISEVDFEEGLRRGYISF